MDSMRKKIYTDVKSILKFIVDNGYKDETIDLVRGLLEDAIYQLEKPDNSKNDNYFLDIDI